MRTEERLQEWQSKYDKARAAWSSEREKMNTREKLYAGSHELKAVTDADKECGEVQTARHIQNIIMENIESEVSVSIPMPKVTARREKDEELALLIENMLRNELDRIAFERINQEQERTVPIQGASTYLVEWDEEDARPGRSGEIAVSAQHPKRFIPQQGVTSGIEDMDYYFLEIPQTREQIKRKYGVEIEHTAETSTEARSTGEDGTSEELVTQVIAYYRNEDGYVGRISWVQDTLLEDEDDYYARKERVCKYCGEVLTARVEIEPMELPTLDGTLPPVQTTGKKKPGVCPYCGGTEFTEKRMEYEVLTAPLTTAHGKIIGNDITYAEGVDLPMMEELKIPYYKPTRFPLILQRNVPMFGKLMGASDVDAIEDQQNTLNRLDKKIIDRICEAGTIITLPPKAELRLSPKDGRIIRLDNPADKNMIGAYDFKGDLEYELFFRANVEEQARKILGITESFQGRNDSTAVSGVAKQFAAAQSAGRLESKRVNKDAAYADIFRTMFELRLAFSDEPRSVVYQDDRGDTVYDQFDRYDFLELDEDTGKWIWNDQFLFSVDASAGLAANRQSMWQEITAAFTSGSFGNPQETETLMLYWSKMEQQHYPGAAETAKYFKEKLQEQEQMAAMQQAMAMQQQAAPTMPGPGAAPIMPEQVQPGMPVT